MKFTIALSFRVMLTEYYMQNCRGLCRTLSSPSPTAEKAATDLLPTLHYIVIFSAHSSLITLGRSLIQKFSVVFVLDTHLENIPPGRKLIFKLSVTQTMSSASPRGSGLSILRRQLSF